LALIVPSLLTRSKLRTGDRKRVIFDLVKFAANEEIIANAVFSVVWNGGQGRNRDADTILKNTQLIDSTSGQKAYNLSHWE
jgi:hypothetical protein